MWSKILRGNDIAIGAIGVGSLLGIGAGTLKLYFQKEKARVETWNEKWRRIASNETNAPWESDRLGLATKYLDQLYPKFPEILAPNQVRTIRVFFPLCGASRDMKYVNDYMTDRINEKQKEMDSSPQVISGKQFGVKNLKLRIVGVEVSKTALEYFLKRVDDRMEMLDSEQKKSIEVSELPDIYQMHYDLFSKIGIYKAKNYYLINTDVFHVATQRLVVRADAVYDRGAFTCIQPKMRKKYCDLIKNVLHKDGRILLTTLRYDESKRKEKGPPYSVEREEIVKRFGEVINNNEEKVSLLESSKWSESDDVWERQLAERLGIEGDGFTEVWLIESFESKNRHFI